ncbi:MAG: hypothetical protein ABIP35_01720 [Ginsengibacter sp.]
MLKLKEEFLKNEFIPLLRQIDPETSPRWGIMNAQQMVEHFADAVKNASGKLILPILNEGERLEKSRQFLLSDIPFKENTDNPLIPKEGIPHRLPDIASAIDKLQKELDHFFHVFEKDPHMQTGNAFFGQLDYAMNIQLLRKHALHHLRQFGIE